MIFYIDCDFSFVPDSEISFFRIAVKIPELNDSGINRLLTLSGDNKTTTNALVVVTLNNVQHVVNRSSCYITGLEVYRGKKEITEIIHGGFSLDYNGNIEV